MSPIAWCKCDAAWVSAHLRLSMDRAFDISLNMSARYYAGLSFACRHMIICLQAD